MMALLTFLDIQTVLIFVITFIIGYELFRKRNTPPGPSGVPILGYLPFIDKEAPYETLLRLKERYGNIYSIQMGNVPTIVVSDPYLIRRLFSSENFSGRAPLFLTHGIMQGYGLICSEGQMWREHRKFVAGVMRVLGMGKNPGGRDLTEQIIMDRVTEFGEFLKETSGNPVDIVPKLRHCIGNIVNALVFGVTYEEDDKTWIYLQHLLDEGFKHVAVAGPLNFLPFLRFLPKFQKTMNFILDGKRKTHIHYEEILSGIEHPSPHFTSVAEAYVAEMSSKGSDCGTFTRQQVYHVLADLFGAGTDTALTTIKWILLFVMKYPEAQRRVHEELDSVVGRSRLLMISDIEKLKYLEAVVCEVQRINNILPLGVPHGCLEDCIVEGFAIKKGTMVLPFIWAMNSDEALWKDPKVFRPERFLKDGKVEKPDFFMPFQVGRRVCLGEDFGRMTMLFFTGVLLQNFSIELSEEYDLTQRGEYGFTLVPRPYKIIATKRC